MKLDLFTSSMLVGDILLIYLFSSGWNTLDDGRQILSVVVFLAWNGGMFLFHKIADELEKQNGHKS